MERMNYLHHYCQTKRTKEYNSDTKRFFIRSQFMEREQKGHIFIGRFVPVLYCAVPKVASTNWKRMMLLFDGIKSNISELSVKSKVHTQAGLRPLYEVKSFNIPQTVSNSFKFLFVRHPFERLVSAYRNKFRDNNTYFERTYGSRILKMFRKGLTTEEYNEGKGATFKEFTIWLIRTETYDPHWYPVTKLCHPCSIRYNFIGKMETLLTDAKQVVNHIGSHTQFPATWSDGYKVSSNNLMFQLFSTLNANQIKGLYEFYQEDFEAFDYGLPRVNKQYNTKDNILLQTMKKILNKKF